MNLVDQPPQLYRFRLCAREFGLFKQKFNAEYAELSQFIDVFGKSICVTIPRHYRDFDSADGWLKGYLTGKGIKLSVFTPTTTKAPQ